MKRVKHKDHKNPRNTAEYLIGRSLHGETPGTLTFQYYLEGVEAEKSVISRCTVEEWSRRLKDERSAVVAEGRRQFAALREQQPVPTAFKRLSFDI